MQPSANAPHPVEKNILMAAVSYIGPLVIVSYLMAKDDPFVAFHIRQGAVLFIIEIVFSILFSEFWSLWIFAQIINLAELVLSVIGIIHAVQGKEDELPLVGHLAVYIPL